nr:unnamed protein product [Spirometra erinaceieuropaei]
MIVISAASVSMPLFTLGILCAFFIITFGNYDNTFHVQPNANFTVMWLSAGKPTSVMLGNMSVPQGDRSNPCKVGEFCWQLLSDKQYSSLQAQSVPGNGSIF